MALERLLFRRSSFPSPFRKKSESQVAVLRSCTKSESQVAENVKNRSVNILSQDAEECIPQTVTVSHNDCDKDIIKDTELVVKDLDIGTGGGDVTNQIDAISGSVEGESAKNQSAIDGYHAKIEKIMEQIKFEQSQKEANVNEYLQLAGLADKQQLLRIKQIFEKKNQKSTILLSTFQKKLEKYQKNIADLEKFGVHKVTKDKLKDMSQNLKDVGANIVDGITGFSGGVVGNIKVAKETIVSKPREFAHLIKNKFGSADNINSMSKWYCELPEEGQTEAETKPGASTLPASFKFGSEDENSSTSGSGFGSHTSPHSSSLLASAQQVTLPQTTFDMLMQQQQEFKEIGLQLQDKLKQLTTDFESYKTKYQQELQFLHATSEDDKFKIERLEEQMNDINELHQHEINNLKQDILSMEEKIEYRLEERTSDISDSLENCHTRVAKMELQQQQQQVISMEMVDNVKFRTILSKLLNVVLAILAVVLVFVSTFANLLAPFLANRTRIISTSILLTSVVLSWKNWVYICDFVTYFLEHICHILPHR